MTDPHPQPAAPASAFPKHPFWDYSLALYRQSGVEAACLAMQDRRGLDVNLLLLCCWAAAAGLPPLTERQLREAIALAGPWTQAVVGPLRKLRRQLRAGHRPFPAPQVEAVRKRVLSAELDAEHAAQLQLAGLVGKVDPAATPARDAAAARLAAGNLAHYLRQRDVVPEAADVAALAILLEAAFPGCDGARLLQDAAPREAHRNARPQRRRR
jgi:uncharacterized protein (TIGR02444 family)